MATGSSIFAATVGSKLLQDFSPAPKTALGIASSTGAGFADGGQPRFEDALKAAVKPAEAAPRDTSAREDAAREDAASDHSAIADASEASEAHRENQVAQRRDSHRVSKKDDKAGPHVKRTHAKNKSDQDQDVEGSGDTEAPASAAAAPAASADESDAADPKHPAAPAKDSAAPVSGAEASAAVSQQIIVGAPVAKNAAAAAPLQASTADIKDSQAAPIAALPAPTAPAKPDKGGGQPVKEAADKAPLPGGEKVAAIKDDSQGKAQANAQGDTSSDSAGEKSGGSQVRAAHPTLAARQVAKPQDKAPDAAPQTPAVNAAPSPSDALASTMAAAAGAISSMSAAPVPAEHEAASADPAVTAMGPTAPAAAGRTDASADAAAPAQQSPPADADQTFEQVVMGLRGKLDARNGKAEIHLEPPNLGTLHVSINLQNGALTAQFQSSSDVVRDLLKNNMEKLKSVLEGQGIAVDKLAVNAPADKIVTATPRNFSQGGAHNDGRSAGQYYRDPQNGQKRQSPASTFARTWRESAAATEEAPIDLVG